MKHEITNAVYCALWNNWESFIAKVIHSNKFTLEEVETLLKLSDLDTFVRFVETCQVNVVCDNEIDSLVGTIKNPMG
jgi:hypothetical protein